MSRIEIPTATESERKSLNDIHADINQMTAELYCTTTGEITTAGDEKLLAFTAEGVPGWVGYPTAETVKLTSERTVGAVFSDVINAKDNGVIGDGLHDDTEKIQDLLTYASSFGTGPKPIIFFPPGDYLITLPITCNIDGLIIQGSGNAAPFNGLTSYAGGTRFMYRGSALSSTQAAFMFGSETDQCRGVSISGFTIDMEDLGNAILGTQLNGASIREITTLKALNGIKFIDGNNNSNSIVECIFYDPTTGGGGIDLTENAHSTDIIRCQFGNKSTGSRAPAYGTRIAQTGNCSSVNIIGSNYDYYRVSRHVYLVSDCKAFAFIGNYIEAKGDGVTGNLLSIDGGSGIIISGNRFTKADTPIATSIDYGISCGVNCEDVAVFGNYFSGFDTACIRFGSGAKNLVTGGNSTGGLLEVKDQNAVDSSIVMNGGTVSAAINARHLSFGSAIKKTISSYAISLSGESRISIETEGLAASGTLRTITGAGSDGHILILCAYDSNHDIIVEDATGNIQLASDFSMLTARSRLTLIWDSAAGLWYELSRSTN